MPPRLSVFIATSLDGFIARQDGSLDWLPQPDVTDAEAFGYHAFMRTVDLLVMGRRTFEMVLGLGPWPFGDRRVLVLAGGTLEIPPGLRDRVTRDAGGPDDLLSRAPLSEASHAYVDGGETIRRFLAAGRIDTLTLTRVPVLLGGGRPLFGPLPGDLALEHVETRAYPNGLVQSRYRRRAAGSGR